MKNIYSHNWYNRNKETYVYGSPVSINNTYSSNIYTTNQINIFAADNSVFAKEINSLLNHKLKKNIPIIISDTEETAYTDGKKIVLTTNFETKSLADKIDIILGQAFHEAAHCLYTDFNIIKNKNICYNELLRHIHNILEDEEIENRLCKLVNIGYNKFFGKLKASLLDENSGSCSEEVVKEKRINQIDEIIMILFCLIRYPKYVNSIDKELLNKYESLFIKINDILVNNFCPAVVNYTECSMYEDSFYNNINITEATCNASFEIYKYIAEYLQEDFEKERKEYEENENSFGNKMIEGLGNGVPMPKSSSEISNEENNKYQSILSGFRHEDIYSGSNSSSVEGKLTIKKSLVRSLDINKYNQLYNQIKHLIPYIKNTIIQNDYIKKDKLEINRFRRNGSLDSRRLVYAMQNINTVYEQRLITQEQVKSNAKYAFVIMIDESGSMTSYDKRETFGPRLATLFAEVFEQYKDIEYYVYGHGDYINPYITKEQRNKYVLGNYDKQGGQDDNAAYIQIINDVKRQTNLPIVVLNITDFYYNTNDKQLIHTLESFKTNGVSFNMICIGKNHTNREKHICQEILNGQVLYLKDASNENEILNVVKELGNMIKQNYNKYSKK